MAKSKFSFKTLIIILFAAGIVWLFASKKVQVESPGGQTDINLVDDDPIATNRPNRYDRDENPINDDSFDDNFEKEFNDEFTNEDMTISIEVNGKKTVIRNPEELKELSRDMENVGREIQRIYLREVSELMRKWANQDVDDIQDDVSVLKRKLRRKLRTLENQYDKDKLKKLERKLMKQLDAITDE